MIVQIPVVLYLLIMALRPVATTVSSSGRQLEKFAQYEPATSVMDYAAIDLDLRTIEARLSLNSATGNAEAFKVYKDGAYSKSYARLTLDYALGLDITMGEEVTGINSEGTQVKGIALTDAKVGDLEVMIEYSVSSYADTRNGCFVGGNPQPITKGCFANTGSIKVGAISLSYKYDALQNNQNARTLQKFSSNALNEMYKCDRCPYKTYKKFYDYYGNFNYADAWVQAAFYKSRTNFLLGDADFSLYKGDGPAVAIGNGISYLSVWMYVIEQLERALDRCPKNDDSMPFWDGAVALYTGFLYESPGSDGYLLYTLAKKQCALYGTCSNGVNKRIHDLFNEGKDLLASTRQCKQVEAVVDKITKLMTVPLVQGLLHDAYSLDLYKDSREKKESSGATFAAALLPLIHNCSAPAAVQIYKDTRVGNGGTGSYEVIKDIIERQYKCLGITCQEVGGILDISSRNYRKNAWPCGIELPSGSTGLATTGSRSPPSAPIRNQNGKNKFNSGMGIILSIGGIVSLVFIFVAVLYWTESRTLKSNKKMRAASTSEVGESSVAKIGEPGVDGSSLPEMM